MSGTCMTFARSKLRGQLSEKRIEDPQRWCVDGDKLAARKYGNNLKKTGSSSHDLVIWTHFCDLWKRKPLKNLHFGESIKRSRLEEAGRCIHLDLC